MNMKTLGKEIKDWAIKQFGEEDAESMFFASLVEEIGELSHALLKKKQKIRYTEEEVDQKIRQEIADVCIALMGLASKLDVDLEQAVLDKWNEVKTRDWKQNPISGGRPESYWNS